MAPARPAVLPRACRDAAAIPPQAVPICGANKEISVMRALRTGLVAGFTVMAALAMPMAAEAHGEGRGYGHYRHHRHHRPPPSYYYRPPPPRYYHRPPPAYYRPPPPYYYRPPPPVYYAPPPPGLGIYIR
ncbi:hypothetical protein GCM10011504_04430 [Siccirubricoccus deserti]|nr:hypothetical protein GCM10011504_04430 [Siccirubricoccus deserti]